MKPSDADPVIILRPFRPEDQDAAKALLLAGLEEHWGSLDLSLNPDLNDIATSYAGGVFLVALSGAHLIGTGALLPTPYAPLPPDPGHPAPFPPDRGRLARSPSAPLPANHGRLATLPPDRGRLARSPSALLPANHGRLATLPPDRGRLARSPSAQIVRMSVAAAVRRHGIGRRILTALCDHARARGIRHLILETTTTWHDVTAFYRAFGFRETHVEGGDTYFELELGAERD